MNTPSAELEVARLVARAKRDKEEAKDRRDAGDIVAAVEVLEETVKALSASPLAAGDGTSLIPTGETLFHRHLYRSRGPSILVR